MTVDLEAVEIASEIPEVQTEPVFKVTMDRYDLIVFDKDGTLCRHKDGKTFINDPADQVMIPGVVEYCKQLREEGKTLAVASNQGGVAFGYMTFEQMIECVQQATDAIGAATFRACPYHPEGTIPQYTRDDACRKPRPGMLLDLMNEFSVDGYNTLFVGDRDEDFQAALDASCGFQWAWDFFGWHPPDEWVAPDVDKGEGYFGEE